MLTILDDRDLGFALGAADYLTKPIDRDRLVRALAHVPPGTRACPRCLVVEDDAAHPRDAASGCSSARAGRSRRPRTAGSASIGSPSASPGADPARPDDARDGRLRVRRPRYGLGRSLARHPDRRADGQDLSDEDRERLSGRVEHVMHKGAYRRDDLLAEVHRHVRPQCGQVSDQHPSPVARYHRVSLICRAHALPRRGARVPDVSGRRGAQRRGPEHVMAAGDEGTGPTPHEDADRASRQELLRGLRHELRTPINHIVGYSELLLEWPRSRGTPSFWPISPGSARPVPTCRRLVNESLDARPGVRCPVPTSTQLGAGLRTHAEHHRRVQRAARRGGRGARVRRPSAGPSAHPHRPAVTCSGRSTPCST